jgi:thymidylate synthase (FAD)
MTQSTVELLTLNNNFNDLTVVNAARVSFNKQKTSLDESDTRLINYLVKHKHWTPVAHPHATISMPTYLLDYKDIVKRKALIAGLHFNEDYINDNIEVTGSLWGLLNLAKYLESRTILNICREHCPISTQAYIENNISTGLLAEYIDDEYVNYLSTPNCKSHDIFSFRITAPIYVARQLVKHQVSLVWNEISGRYVSLDIGMEIPEVWNAPADSVKQGSSDTPIVQVPVSLPYRREDGGWNYLTLSYEDIVKLNKKWYDNNNFIISNEKRRKILPLSTFTSWIWTGTREAFNGVVATRNHGGTQQETLLVVNQIEEILKNESKLI